MRYACRLVLSAVTVMMAGLFLFGAGLLAADRPNVIVILADDLGYGDVQSLNPDGKLPTPNIDRIAREGMAFTDAHTSSSVCTPTRYGLLTGRYNWRTRLQKGVLWGLSLPLIAPDRLTIGKMLQAKGYHTAAIGKWHLGMEWYGNDGKLIEDGDRWDAKSKLAERVDYSRPVKQGPTTRGFDYFFGITASLDMPPFVYIRNDQPLVTKIVRKKFLRTGATDVDFDAVDVLPRLTDEAVAYLERRAQDRDRPFFLYFPLTAPHTPIVPTDEWKGKSGINAYGDFVMQVDETVGRVLEALDRLDLADNTLLIFTSDNGCSPAAKFAELRAKGHNPSYHFRGHKADIFEGGHRVPFLVRWPGKVARGSRSDQLVCLTDVMRTVAEVVDADLPPNAAEDSLSFLSALFDERDSPRRESVIHHSINGSFAIRRGQWKLELCPGSGGWSSPRPNSKQARQLPPIQLYDLNADIGEKHNVQGEHPDVVQKLRAELEEIVRHGRSTPGPAQSNDVEVTIVPAPR